MLPHLYCLQNVSYLLLVRHFLRIWRLLWFKSLENDGSWFACFIMNLSLYFWQSSGHLCHFCVHDKLNYVSLWDTYHVVCAYTQNFVDIFYHGVFLYLLMLLEISNNPCFLVLQICLWEPFLPISDKQSTTQFCSFWSIFCNMLLSLKETTLWFHNWVTS